MNKLEKKLSQGQTEIMNQRALIVSEDIQSEIESVITDLEKKRREIVKNKLNHTDIGPDNSTSLRVVDENFNASSWVSRLVDIEKALVLIEIELTVANNIKKEWLDEVE